MEKNFLTNEEYQEAGDKFEKLAKPLIAFIEELQPYIIGTLYGNSPRARVISLQEELQKMTKEVGDGFGVVSQRIQAEEDRKRQAAEDEKRRKEAEEKAAFDNSIEGRLAALEKAQGIRQPVKSRTIDLSPHNSMLPNIYS
jgi:hypothetical protein